MGKKYTDVYLEQLAHKYLTATLTEKEQADFDDWYNSHNDAEFEHSAAENPLLVKTRMYRYLQDGMLASQLNPVRKYPFKWYKVVTAACLLLIAGTAVYFFQSKNAAETDLKASYTANIKPGRNTATLTLANGKKIRLSESLNGELAKEAGMSITKTASGQLIYEVKGGTKETYKINTLSTANGETYMVILPDQSKVWLNAASSLTYATAVNERGERLVELNGEAYFEIAKDRAHPFIVKSADQLVEVFGTHFNVNSYPNEGSTKTTLLEGSVRVSTNLKATASPGLLHPGQQAIVRNGNINIIAVDGGEETAWKNGGFSFNGQDLKTVMRMIARWYDVEVDYEFDPVGLHIGGEVSRSRSVTEVLKMLEVTGYVKFKITGRRITVFR